MSLLRTAGSSKLVRGGRLIERRPQAPSPARPNRSPAISTPCGCALDQVVQPTGRGRDTTSRSNGAGERAARAAAQRWLGEGRNVRLALPPEPGTDFADVLLGHAYARIHEVRDVAA
jgi:hypothetical protein